MTKSEILKKILAMGLALTSFVPVVGAVKKKHKTTELKIHKHRNCFLERYCVNTNTRKDSDSNQEIFPARRPFKDRVFENKFPSLKRPIEYMSIRRDSTSEFEPSLKRICLDKSIEIKEPEEILYANLAIWKGVPVFWDRCGFIKKKVYELYKVKEVRDKVFEYDGEKDERIEALRYLFLIIEGKITNIIKTFWKSDV